MAKRCYEYAQARDGSWNALETCDGAFRGSLTRRERAASFINRAIVRGARGDLDGALADLDRATALTPDAAAAHINRGEIYVRQERWSDAAAAFSRSLELGPANPAQAYFGRGVAREGAGDIEGAYADYFAAARLAPRWDEPLRQLERFEVARPRRLTAKS
jgi:tetratricopeptide (TPR) repeat protein